MDSWVYPKTCEARGAGRGIDYCNVPRWLSRSLEAHSSLDSPKGFRVSPSQNRSDVRSKSMIIRLGPVDSRLAIRPLPCHFLLQ